LYSHLSPLSNASGSVRVASNVHSPESSLGSHSSHHSRATTGGSGASLSTSVSSDGRLRRPEVGENPLPSSFGRMSVGATGANVTRLTIGSPIPPSPLHQRHDSHASPTASLDRGSNVTTEVVNSVTGAPVQLPRAPAGGSSVERGHSLWETGIPE
jgi:hypothetical protein